MGRLFNERGPIARSHADLQSIDIIDKIFQISADENKEHSRSGAVFHMQCAMLFAISCADLSLRTSKIAEHIQAGRSLAKLCDHICWLEAMMRLATNAARTSLTAAGFGTAERTSDGLQRSEILSNLTTANSMLDESLFRVFNKYTRVDALFGVQFGNSHPLAVMAHRLKIYFHTNREFYKYVAFWTAIDVKNIDILQEKSLEEAYFKHLIIGDNYFSQFRVLHQAPELLARFCKWRIDHVLTAKSINPNDIVIELMRIGTAVQQIAQHTKPLVYLMMPAHYHEIRANLGQTSGSDSQALARSIFRDELLQLISFVEEQHSSSAACRIALSAIEGSVDTWREMHLNLPRNLLGIGDVRSLIGAKEAVSSAASMRSAFVRRRHPRTAQMKNDDSTATLMKSEALLLDQTSKVTKEKFEQVQSRQGPFAPENRFFEERREESDE